MSYLPNEFYHSGPGKGFPVKVPGGFALFVSTKLVHECCDYGDSNVYEYDILYEMDSGELFFLRAEISEPDCFSGDDERSKYNDLLHWKKGIPDAKLLSAALSDPIFKKMTDIEEYNGYDIVHPGSKETKEYAMEESTPKEMSEMSSDDYKQLRKQGLLYW